MRYVQRHLLPAWSSKTSPGQFACRHRVMEQEDSDWGRSVSLAETSSPWDDGKRGEDFSLSEEPPSVAVQGSAFCNSNQDTLCLLCPQPSAPKFRNRDSAMNLTLFQYLHFMSHFSHLHNLILTEFLFYTALSNSRQHFPLNLLAYFIVWQSPFTFLIFLQMAQINLTLCPTLKNLFIIICASLKIVPPFLLEHIA